MITTLIVEDEPLGRADLRQALEAQGAAILGEAADGALALQLAEDLGPDLIVLDLDLSPPEGPGLQVARALAALDPAALVALVSRSSEHAVAAFELGVMDYLLRPVAPERLAKMVARARSRLADRRARREAAERERAGAEPAPRVRVPVWTPAAVRLLRLEEIDWIERREKQVIVRTAAGEYRTDRTLCQLEAVLPPEQFFRLHHAALVKLERVEELLFLGNHRYAVRLTGDQVLPVGRSQYPGLRQRLGLDLLREPGPGGTAREGERWRGRRRALAR